MSKFSTLFENPVKFAGYPLTLGIVIDETATGPLYFQRRYLDINRQLLETKSTLIPQSDYGKYLRLNIDDSMLDCAAFVETDITDTNINTVGSCQGEEIIYPCPPTNAAATPQSSTEILLTWDNTPCAPLVAPVSNVSAGAITSTSITLNWSNPA